MSNDLIIKKAVLDKFQAICDLCGEYEKYNGVMCGACRLDDGISIVEEMSTIEEKCQLSEKTAKVTNRFMLVTGGMGGTLPVCECGFFVSDKYTYCPACGARLEWE